MVDWSITKFLGLGTEKSGSDEVQEPDLPLKSPPTPPPKDEMDEQTVAKIREYNRVQRLNLAPSIRITLAGVIGGGYGLASGFYQGFSKGALKYLAENAHRMPTTKGGWYFYHKRKNYVVIKDGLVNGFKQGSKFGVVAACYFGIEAYIDRLRSRIDFLSTTAASAIVGYGYGAVYGLSRGQALRSSRAFTIVGTMTGLLQDFMRYQRGNDIWYLSKVGLGSGGESKREELSALSSE